jgi:broad specificity phosphatase PhoE
VAEARRYRFVRHAEATHQAPAWEPGARAGRDARLTARGERQAETLARTLAHEGVERVVSSSLVRAKQTAERIAAASGAPYEHVWPELDEIAPRKLLLQPPARRRPEWWDGIACAYHVYRGRAGGPVDVASVQARVRTVLARLDALPERHVAVVGHGYWILLMALIVPGPFRLKPIPNCSITEVRVAKARHELVGFAVRGPRTSEETNTDR